MLRLRGLAVLLVVALVGAACGSDSGTATDNPTTTAAETTTTAAETTTVIADEPETEAEAETDEDDEIVEEEPAQDNPVDLAVEELLVEWQESNGAPGVAISVRMPDGHHAFMSSGVADIVTEAPVFPESYFRIASITKTMTAAVVLQLVEEGLVELDEPIQTYLPGWLDGYPYAADITVRQAMDHTNGLIEYAFDPEFYAFAGTRLDQPFEPDELYGFLAGTEPLFAPGEAYSYETGGFFALGSVIEAVTGNTAADEMRTRIFEPAGAENIYLTPQEFPPEEAINGYGRELLYVAAFQLIGRTDEEGLTINDEPVAAMKSIPQDVLQSTGWTGGGNEAQMESVSAIFRALFDGTILSDESIALMTDTVFDADYGLGLSVDVIDGVTVYSHGGGVPGFRSHAAYLPEYDIAYAFSSNLIPLPEGTDVGVIERELIPVLIDLAS